MTAKAAEGGPGLRLVQGHGAAVEESIEEEKGQGHTRGQGQGLPGQDHGQGLETGVGERARRSLLTEAAVAGAPGGAEVPHTARILRGQGQDRDHEIAAGAAPGADLLETTTTEKTLVPF